jgi:hypothetical protein
MDLGILNFLSRQIHSYNCPMKRWREDPRPSRVLKPNIFQDEEDYITSDNFNVDKICCYTVYSSLYTTGLQVNSVM